MSGGRGDRQRRPIDPAREAKRAERRAQLIDAAVEAIRRDGAAVSMEVIAAEAGVTKPIVYRHFGDRDGLATAIAERVAGDLVTKIAASLSSDSPPRELLRSTIDAYLAYIEHDPSVYRFLVSRLGAPESGLGTGTDLVSDIARRVALVLGEQLRSGGRDSGPAEPWAFGIVGMVHFAGDWWLGTKTMTRASLTEYLTTLLWHGLADMPGDPEGVAGLARRSTP